MAERNQEVFARVREELALRPDIPHGVLYQMAQAIDPAIRTHTQQQFHIRYVLPAVQEIQASPEQRQRRRRSDAKKAARQPRRGRAAARAATAPATRAPQPEQPQPAEQPPQPGLEQPEPPERAEPAAPRPARRRRPERPSRAERERIRGIFLRFAMALAHAETPVEIVAVIQQVGGFVEEALRREE